MDSHHSWWHHSSSSGVIVHVSAGLLLGGAILYWWNQTSLKEWVDCSFVHSHMNDCLAGVILVSYANLLCLGARRPTFCLTTPPSIVGFMLTVGFFWEFVTPLYRADSVPDAVDLVAYAAGGIVYWIVLKGTEQMHSHGRETLRRFALLITLGKLWTDHLKPCFL